MALLNRETFAYILDERAYMWFIIMCNMDFFSERIEWGTSIRGAWWDIYGKKEFEIKSCGLYEGEEQILEPLKFNKDQWGLFIKAMQEFVKCE